MENLEKIIYIPLILFLFAFTTFKNPTEQKKEVDDDLKEVLRLVNELRVEGCYCGNERMPPAAPLIWNEQLAEAAHKHSEDMRNHKNMSHTGSDGSTFYERVLRTGYDPSAVGENVAQGQRTPEVVVMAWQQSPGHCKNMMRPDFTEIGVGKAEGEGSSDGMPEIYWTQVFAAPMESDKKLEDTKPQEEGTIRFSTSYRTVNGVRTTIYKINGKEISQEEYERTLKEFKNR